MLILPSSFEKVKKWLTSSGLVVNDIKDENYGGVHSFYDLKNNEYGFLYPEITGYYISTLRFLYELEKDQKYLELAKHSADWLISIYEKYGGIIQGLDGNKPRSKNVFSFDTAVCAKALIDYYLLSDEKKYLDYGKRMVSWLVDEALDEDGTVKPIKNLDENKFTVSNEVWYKQKGCLHIKTAMPLLSLYELTKDNILLDKATKICNTYNKFQRDDGSISLHQNNNAVNLHTQCYAIEGLLYAFYLTKNNHYLEICKRALMWASARIENDGSIQLWFGSKYKSKSSYATAQLIRLMILVDKLDDNTSYKNQTERLYSFLTSLQVHDKDTRIDGGFYEELYKSLFGWQKRARINSWGSMFALQAINWFENYENLSFSDSIKLLF